MANEQRVVHFSGMVQGVGFRYTACRAASRYDVGGYVRNLPDGQVECLVEGDSEQIDRFLADLSRKMDGYIQDVRQETLAYTGHFATFGVRY